MPNVIIKVMGGGVSKEEFNKMQNQLTGQISQMNLLQKDTMIKHNNEINAKNMQIAALEGQISRLESEMGMLRQENAQLKMQIEKLEGQVASLQSDVKALMAKFDQMLGPLLEGQAQNRQSIQMLTQMAQTMLSSAGQPGVNVNF